MRNDEGRMSNGYSSASRWATGWPLTYIIAKDHELERDSSREGLDCLCVYIYDYKCRAQELALLQSAEAQI